MNLTIKEFVRELKTYLRENTFRFTEDVQGRGGCPTCGYGADTYHDLDMDDLEEQIDEFAKTFEENSND